MNQALPDGTIAYALGTSPMMIRRQKCLAATDFIGGQVMQTITSTFSGYYYRDNKRAD